MKTYAHWLDGEYRKALTNVTVEKPVSAEDAQAQRLLKTLALFGGSFVLSDVQIVDSPVLWEAFSQGDFRRFLHSNSEFLELRVLPVISGKDPRWAIATSGLERALRVGRIASPMRENGSVIRLCQELLSAGPTGDFDELLSARKLSPDFKALCGFVEAVKYFSAPSARVHELTTKPAHNLYTILEVALGNSDLIGVDRRHVEQTKQLIDSLVENPTERTRRAVIYERLDPANRQHRASWKTIVQAWNVAAQKSVCETGGSIGRMANVVPIGAYVDQTADLMLESPADDLSPTVRRFTEVIPEIPLTWDPGDLGWDDLLKISEDTKCADARSEMQAALLSADQENITSTIKKYSDSIAPMIKGRLQPPVKPWIWLVGQVIVSFGGPAAPMLRVALVGGQGVQWSLVRAVNNLRDKVIAARIVAAANRVVVSR